MTPRKSTLVEERINNLLVSSVDSVARTESPGLRKLQENNSENVRKLRGIFENGIVEEEQQIESPNSPNESPTVDKEHSSKATMATRKKSNSPSTPAAKFLSRARQSFDCLKRQSPTTSPKKPTNRTEQILNEIVSREVEYIETLERGVENYVRLIDEDSAEIPHQIHHEKFKLFGNIEEIHLLHKLIVLPELVACGSDVSTLAELFTRLTDNDTFYPYISFAICYNNAKAMALSQAEFFRTVQQRCGDPLGVFSFLLQPIQKLARYPLLLEEIIKDLSREMHENKSALASLCVAKKKLERYLARMNQSLKLNDIAEAHQLAIKLQYDVLTSLQIEFGVDVNEPTFLIVPTFSDFANFQTPFNIFDFGKFIKTESMECHEQEPTYRFFYGEIFLFEKCLMYTKKSECNGKQLFYRDKFKFGPGVSLELRQDERTLTISAGARVVAFTARTIEKILQFHDLIRSFYDPRKSTDSAFFDEHFVTKPATAAAAVVAEGVEHKDHSHKDKSFEDAKMDNEDDDDDDDEEDDCLSFANSEYEYGNFDSDSSFDDTSDGSVDNDDEQNNFLQISNSRFYVPSD